MHKKMLDEIIARCRQRLEEGDCPTVNSFNVELLEGAIIELARSPQAGSEAGSECMNLLSGLAGEILRINKANGWKATKPEDWKDEYKMLAVLMLITTEVAEAAEAVRNNDRENFAEELADVIIRCLDTCGGMGINIDAEIAKKLEKNRNRGHKHGGKRV